jgi:hypothetical protein
MLVRGLNDGRHTFANSFLMVLLNKISAAHAGGRAIPYPPTANRYFLY